VEEERRGGGSRAQIEAALLEEQLSGLALAVHEVPADGDCLYASVAHQLAIQQSGGEVPFGLRRTKTAYASSAALRVAAVQHMLEHRGDFEPFLADQGDFDAYCAKMRDTSAWGGQPELQALSHHLQLPIDVYSAGQAVVNMGSEYASAGDGGAPLRVSYHRNAYSLGEHFNSLVASDGKADGEETL